jgi:selenide,water dikinase
MGAASALLAPVAHVMTDVTGFGLAGHLLEILQASGCAARLDLACVPVLAGAEALAAAGHASSLAPANRAAAAPRMVFTENPRAALLFDPQTAGGLLAAVPQDRRRRWSRRCARRARRPRSSAGSRRGPRA